MAASDMSAARKTPVKPDLTVVPIASAAPKVVKPPAKSTLPAAGVTAKPPSTTNTARVDVFERKTGRVLTGSAAPTVGDLRRWLLEHPTFEVVNPGSAHALAIQAKRQQLKQLARDMQQQDGQRVAQPQKVQTTLRIGPSKKVQLVNPQASASSATSATASVSSTPPPSAPSVAKSGAPRTNNNTPAIPAAVKARPTAAAGRGHQTEPVRVNVQRTLKEQLTVRMNELAAAADEKTPPHPKLSADEIEHFVIDTEREIYQHFGRDTGMKYRAKYRSIMFNLTDRKNATLFRKICERSCGAADLVRMSAEEMASQELAQWREKETKHQLEIIKKSELDLVACAKNYAATSAAADAADAVAIEAVVSANPQRNLTVSSSTGEALLELGKGALATSTAKDTRIDSRFERGMSAAAGADKKPSGTTKRGRSKSRDQPDELSDARSRSSTSSSKHSNSKRSRDKDDRQQTSSGSGDHRGRDKYRSSDSRMAEREREKERDKQSARRRKSPPKPVVADNVNIIEKIMQAQETIDRILRTDAESATNAVAEVASARTTFVSDLAHSVAVTMPTPPDSLHQHDGDVINIDDDDDDDASASASAGENCSTAKAPLSAAVVAVSEPPLPSPSQQQYQQLPDAYWTGSIFMIDVATFQISVSPVIGDAASLPGELPAELEIVGRIRAEQVWDYVQKLRRSQHNDVRLVRFGSGTADDADAYYTLYEYMLTRKRYGVIKPKVPFIKDFYIFPLEPHADLPAVLPQHGGEFEPQRPPLLMGLMVFNRLSGAKRVATTANAASTKMARMSGEPVIAAQKKIAAILDETRYTPPSSPRPNLVSAPFNAVGNASSILVAAAAANKDKFKVLDDGDEPYSPGGGASSDNDDDDDDAIARTLPSLAQSTAKQTLAALLTTTTTPTIDASVHIPGLDVGLSDVGDLNQVEIQRRVEELTRRIEQQKMEIAGMMHGDRAVPVDLDSLDEPYSPSSILLVENGVTPATAVATTTSTSAVAAVVANIAIPSNLQEILNSIKSSGGGVQPYSNEEYDPLASLMMGGRSYGGGGGSNTAAAAGTSKLAQLTDEELMSMVPDDIRASIVQPPPKKYHKQQHHQHHQHHQQHQQHHHHQHQHFEAGAIGGTSATDEEYVP